MKIVHILKSKIKKLQKPNSTKFWGKTQKIQSSQYTKSQPALFGLKFYNIFDLLPPSQGYRH